MSWPLVKLGEVAPSKALKNPVVLSDDNVWQLNLDMVESNSGRIINKLKAPLSEAGSSTHWFDERHVLYSKLRPYLNKVVLPDEQGLATTELVPMLPDPEKLDRRYLVHYLRSKQFVSWISDQVAGAKMPRVSMKIFWDHEIPLPPLAEQKRIAAILDKADAIRQKRKQAIELADEFLRSVFLDMFGDPLDPNSKVMTFPMTEVFNITTGKLNSNAAVEGGQYPFFTCAKEIFAIDDYAFEQEALLLAGNNAQADYDVKHYKGKFNAYQRTYVLTLKDEQQSYPFYKFALEYQLKNLKRFSKGSNTKYITMEIMERTMLPVPSNTLQNEFVKKYSKKAELLKSYCLQVDFFNNNFNSLSQKAFSGQL
ncbi:restriction endonuclease subunit S [Vibrio parahaemolyticus]|uniref:restriction endonuclease subunit S n=1 Tax=Vibrio parahaemolyticus TaxID=670 RepID=UPI0015B97F87|nr:restriction endonuclease subunit S [Vibrio parahaemolyticus]